MTIEGDSHSYVAKFMCPNCGDIFEKLLQKGVPSQGRGGKCPICGVFDGQPQVGGFKVIKKNETEGHNYQGYR